MTIEAHVRPAAAAELEDAFRWYEARRTGLGVEFLGAVDDAITSLVERPLAYGVVHRNVQRVLLRRFPYGLFYIAGAGTVVVVACFHVRRDPAQWPVNG